MHMHICDNLNHGFHMLNMAIISNLGRLGDDGVGFVPDHPATLVSFYADKGSHKVADLRGYLGPCH